MGLLELRKWTSRFGHVNNRKGLKELYRLLRMERVHSRMGLSALEIDRHSVRNSAGSTGKVEVKVEPQDQHNYPRGCELGEVHSYCSWAELEPGTMHNHRWLGPILADELLGSQSRQMKEDQQPPVALALVHAPRPVPQCCPPHSIKAVN